jgi:hypothetical protein
MEQAADEIERLRKQLPETMQDCTIQFKECEYGHGRLTATNWVDNGCPTCEIKRLRHEMAPLAEAFYLRDVRGQIEVLHDQIAGQQEKIERLRKAMTMIYDTLFLAGSLLGTEEAIKEAMRIARAELEKKHD